MDSVETVKILLFEDNPGDTDLIRILCSRNSLSHMNLKMLKL